MKKQMTILLIVVGMLIGVGSCDRKDTPPTKTIVYTTISLRVGGISGYATIQLRMTKNQIETIKGRPDSINRTVGSWGVHEQWVYDYDMAQMKEIYLYFENGILTSWQN